MDLKRVINGIKPVDGSLKERVQSKLDRLTKPLGSLGKLEETAKKLACAFDDEEAKINKKAVMVFASDHGVTAESVSLYPKEVTAQMVYNFIAGGAGINVLARHADADVFVVDIGVDTEFPDDDKLLDKKVSYGTKNMLLEPAMSEAEAYGSITAGYDGALDLINKGYNVIGLGEMGIGNTTAASAVTSVITGLSAETVTGRGTGIGDELLKNKVSVIKRAIKLHSPDKGDAVDILSKVGGFELGGIAGACLACAENRAVAVIDGFISTAGAAIAHLISPKVSDYILASHNSVERGHVKLLGHMGLVPILDLDLRLGEGTGAALAMNIMEASVKILNEMATFESANVSKADK